MSYKYIAVTSNRKKPATCYHTRRDCPMLRNSKVVRATASLLKYHNITEECKVCQSMTKIPEPELTDQDLVICSLASIVLGKHLSREDLRAKCDLASITYNLRMSKANLASKWTIYMLSVGDYEDLIEITKEARNFWYYKIKDKDRHRPGYYKLMLDHSKKLLELLKGKLNDRTD